MNVLLLMDSNKCSKNSIFPRITGLNNAKISINSCIALMEIDANFIMIMTPINSQKCLLVTHKKKIKLKIYSMNSLQINKLI